MSYYSEADRIEAAAEREIRAVEKRYEQTIDRLGVVIDARQNRIAELEAAVRTILAAYDLFVDDDDFDALAGAVAELRAALR